MFHGGCHGAIEPESLRDSRGRRAAAFGFMGTATERALLTELPVSLHGLYESRDGNAIRARHERSTLI